MLAVEKGVARWEIYGSPFARRVANLILFMSVEKLVLSLSTVIAVKYFCISSEMPRSSAISSPS